MRLEFFEFIALISLNRISSFRVFFNDRVVETSFYECVALDSARITLEVNHKSVRIDLRTKGFKIQK